MQYVGVDGCREGWLAVALQEDANFDVEMVRNIDKIWELYQNAKLILVDIPIGLRNRNTAWRLCDIEAYKRLGYRRFSVFWTPCRSATKVFDYNEANRINRQNMSKGLSTQAWGIVPKIREVDIFLKLNKSARGVIRETHPEICFWAFNNYSSMTFNKKTEEGFKERIRILNRYFHQTRNVIRSAESKYGSSIAKDDILDALAAAITATKEDLGLATLPSEPETDSHGLPMEIVFCRSPLRI